MWFAPENVHATSRRIIDSGIAQMMMDDVSNQPMREPITYDIERCRFWVQPDLNPLDRSEIIAVVVQYPPSGHMQAWRSKPLADYDQEALRDLSDEQNALLEELVIEWKQLITS